MLNSVKYIFLDFDGPLNTGRSDYMDPYRYGHHSTTWRYVTSVE